MLVDDPVKRVDNMTMAFGLEARTPFLDHDLVELAAACPPALKLAHDGKGVLKDAARRVLPAEVIDRPKGYFPVPALSHLEGPYVELVREALHAPGGARPRALRPGVGRPPARRAQRAPHDARRATACGSSACSSCGCRRRACDQFAGRSLNRRDQYSDEDFVSLPMRLPAAETTSQVPRKPSLSICPGRTSAVRV